jgi:hypothetical protein
VQPGVHTANEPCPCAAGFTCWSSTTCLQLCRTDAPSGSDGGCAGVCQGGVSPYGADSGIGYCVEY